jgi:two-component system response regulator PilR (NtrC family)
MKAGRILVVDDEETIRLTLDECLTSIGYEVVTASNGEDALQKFVPGKFDCVISDLMMPAMDGMELLKRIRLKDGDVYFLMITGYPGIDSAVNAMKEGAYDYLTKPFHMEDIQMKIEKAIHVKKTEASLKKIKNLFLTLIILIPILVSLGIIFGIFWKNLK